MKLVRLTLESFRGAPDGAYAFTSPSDGAPLDTVYVTGAASSGKTAFLEAIAALKESVGAYGLPPNPARLLRRGAKAGRIEGTWQLSPAERERAETRQATCTAALELGEGVVPALADPGLRQLFAAYSHDPAQGKLEYFPANRRLSGRETARPAPVAREAALRLGSSPDKYASIPRALIELALADGVEAVEAATARGVLLKGDLRDSLAPYRRDLAELAPGIRLLGVRHGGDGPELVFERADGARLALDELSDSERQAVLFCVTFRRIGLSRSIVLIDQPELYLHADAQLRFARALGLLGTDNQMFLATGSLEITRTAAPHQIIKLGGAKA